jgi:glycosyltransferase involved in cell wall biosynthesis
MAKPAVSIIIPTYNRAELLRQALDSVAAQTFRDYEVIVVDDGSMPPIAEAVAGHPCQPRIIRQARQGPAAARNRGIAESRGDLVAFLDSDDLWMPLKLERFVSALRENPAISIFYGPMQPINSESLKVDGRTKPRHAGRITDALFKSCFVDVPTVVCRKELLTRVGGFDASLPVCEDYDLWLRLSLSEPFGLIDEPLARRRLHDDRLSKSAMARNLATRARMLLRFYEQNKNALDQRIASRRLGRVFFVAARAALKERDYPLAIELSRTSLTFRRRSLRTLVLYVAATLYTFFSGSGRPKNISSSPTSQPG